MPDMQRSTTSCSAWPDVVQGEEASKVNGLVFARRGQRLQRTGARAIAAREVNKTVARGFLALGRNALGIGRAGSVLRLG